jgi:DNA repair exonuclease SbcCD ATPase subunit
MPGPPKRRTLGVSTPSGTSQTEELWAEVQSIQSRFAQLEASAQLADIYTAIGDFDAKLVQLPTTLDTLRERGYVHSGQLDDQLEALDDRWDKIRPRVESTLQTQVRRLDREMDETERQVDKLRANRSAIRSADSAVDSLSRRIQSARSAVEGLYQGMESDLDGIAHSISIVTHMMDLLDESQEIRLHEAEGPLHAVKAEWQRDGKEGPEGILFLTDQRLLFEQRQEVVTKKVLGIFKTDSEEVEDLLLDAQVAEVESVSDKEEGGFLGIGKDDILEFVFAATAPVSRARFHLKGQDSADWAAMIKRVQTGEIDEDRADDYVEELEEAEATAAAFPEQCPNCFAAVPPPARGVSNVTCEFCGTVITPES